MSGNSILVLLLALTAIALFMVSMINQRQTRARLIQQKLSRMQRRVSELEELAATAEPLVESKAVAKVIHDEATDNIRAMVNLAPQTPLFQVSLETAERHAKELSNPTGKAPLCRMMASDAAIAQAQYALSEAARIVRKRQASGLLREAETDSLLRDLSWANYMVKVASNIGQGQTAARRGDRLRALSYYQTALEVATAERHQDERQERIISEIGELLNGKREALSRNLMPEAPHQNVPQNPPAGSPNNGISP